MHVIVQKKINESSIKECIHINIRILSLLRFVGHFNKSLFQVRFSVCCFRSKQNNHHEVFMFMCLCSLSAELLREGHHGGGSEEDRHLLPAADQRQRGDHVRLQVPHRGREDPLFVWGGELQRNADTKKNLLLVERERVRGRVQAPPDSPYEEEEVKQGPARIKFKLPVRNSSHI